MLGAARQAAADCDAPGGVHELVLADAVAAATLVDSPDVALVSATGSERMGAQVAPRVAARLGRFLLELGGNNAAVVAPSADLELATRGIVFAAAGTAGQRCTSLRRVIAHEDIVAELVSKMPSLRPPGDRRPGRRRRAGRPVDQRARVRGNGAALMQARGDGGELLVGGSRREFDGAPDAFYVEPALVRMPSQTASCAARRSRRSST